MDGLMAGWIDGWMYGWIDGWMYGWIDGWMYGWMDACRDVWIYVNTYAYIYASMYVCAHTHIPVPPACTSTEAAAVPGDGLALEANLRFSRQQQEVQEDQGSRVYCLWQLS